MTDSYGWLDDVVAALRGASSTAVGLAALFGHAHDPAGFREQYRVDQPVIDGIEGVSVLATPPSEAADTVIVRVRAALGLSSQSLDARFGRGTLTMGADPRGFAMLRYDLGSQALTTGDLPLAGEADCVVFATLLAGTHCVADLTFRRYVNSVMAAPTVR